MPTKRETERTVTEEQKEKLEAIAVQVHRVEELLGSPGWARVDLERSLRKKKEEREKVRKVVGERLKKVRRSLGLTQREFAQRVGGKVDYTYIGKIERGHQYPSLKMLERIGKAFSVPLGYFFEDDSFLKSLDLLPSEIKGLLKDKKRQHWLRMSQELKERDLDLLIEITNILLHAPT